MSAVSSKHAKPPAGAGADAVAVKKPISWNPFAAILIVVGLFLVGQTLAVILISVAFGHLSALFGGADSNLRQFWFVFLAEALTLGGLLAVLHTKKQSWAFIGLGRPKFRQLGRDVLYAVIGYGAYFVLYVVVVSIAIHIAPSLNITQKQDIGFTPGKNIGQILPVFVALVILAPLTEEALVRGFLFRNLRIRMGFGWATLIASILFGAAHLTGGEQGAALLWIAAIDTFSLSLVLCYLREKSGRLWPCVGLHALKNLTAFITLFVIAH
jgi:membrane protease YdiL (CAAX protease family)